MRGSKADGFYKNPLIFIPRRTRLKMKEKIIEPWFREKNKWVWDEPEQGRWRGFKKPRRFFWTLLPTWAFRMAFKILKGNDTAATNYLRSATYEPLRAKNSLPIVKEAIEKVKVTSYWNPLVTSYNKIPFVKKQNPDLEAYVTTKAINGLMLMIATRNATYARTPRQG